MLNFLSVPTLVVATMLAMPASAVTVEVNSQHSSIFGDENGQNRWFVGSSLQVGTQSISNAAVGAFRLTAPTMDGSFASFLAFCLEPLKPLHMPNTYTIGSLFSDQITQDLQALAAGAMHQVVDSQSAAAFQMAAWEITTETGAYDIDDGFFQVTGTSTASNGAELLAQGWLDNVSLQNWAAPPSAQQFTILNAPGVQDLLTNVAPVPIPAAGLLMLGGLAGLGGLSARRRARA